MSRLRGGEEIAEAAKAACDVLDETYPGWDAGGITSNFQGLLEDVIRHMLSGGSLLDQQRGHYVKLPQLICDEEIFGDPRVPGRMFLPVMELGRVKRAYRCCEPAKLSCPRPVLGGIDAGRTHHRLVPLLKVLAAWTSFEAAVDAAFEYCELVGLKTPDAIRKARIRVVPVQFAQKSGFVVTREGRMSWMEME